VLAATAYSSKAAYRRPEPNVEAFAQALPVGLGFAGGAMTWMVFAQIVPDALRSSRAGRKGIAFR
jgi:zinc transporter ZupT